MMNDPHTQDDDSQNPFTDPHFQFFLKVTSTPHIDDMNIDKGNIPRNIHIQAGRVIHYTEGKVNCDVYYMKVLNYEGKLDLEGFLSADTTRISHEPEVLLDPDNIPLNNNHVNFSRMRQIYEFGFKKPNGKNRVHNIAVNSFIHYYSLIGYMPDGEIDILKELKMLTTSTDYMFSDDYFQEILKGLERTSFREFSLAFTAYEKICNLVEFFMSLTPEMIKKYEPKN
tara:strand:+ start:405 stop:1082 length:678 start_codon:yes stop_codon:yes gene_type:complete